MVSSTGDSSACGCSCRSACSPAHSGCAVRADPSWPWRWGSGVSRRLAGCNRHWRPPLATRVFDWFDRRRTARGWTAADGQPAPVPVEDAEHAVTLLEHGGRPLAAIIHDPVLREDPALVGSVMAVLRLAVENERLDTELQARLDEVRASRARLVAAAEDERRRVERDLHDGAQQRLVAVTIALQQARQTATTTDAAPKLVEALEKVAAELQGAIRELRELARGIHPAILEDAGLAAAVAALGRRAGLAVDLDVELDRRLPRHIETTTYFTVAEALTNAARHAQADHARVTLRDGGDRLLIEIADDGVGGADPRRGSGLHGLADRLGAVDGTIEINSPAGGGTRIRAEVPVRDYNAGQAHSRGRGGRLGGDPLRCRHHPRGRRDVGGHGGDALEAFISLPCYAVGEATARAARKAGFGQVTVGTGDGHDALALARKDEKRRILHLCGRDHRIIELPGLALTRCEVYAVDPVAELPLLARMALSKGAAILIHSSRAAAHFANLVDKEGMDRSAITLIAISAAAAQAAGEGWRDTLIAAAPRDEALLELAAKLCKTGPAQA